MNQKMRKTLRIMLVVSLVMMAVFLSNAIGRHKAELQFKSQRTKEREVIVIKDDFNWTASRLGKMIPIPAYTKSKIEVDKLDQFVVFFSDISEERFDKYVEECKEAGFYINQVRDFDPDKMEYYSAENEDEVLLKLKHVEFDILRIELISPEYDWDSYLEFQESYHAFMSDFTPEDLGEVELYLTFKSQMSSYNE